MNLVKKEEKKTVGDLIQTMKPELKKAVPRNFDMDKFLRIVMTEIRINPKLEKCTIPSLLGAIMTAAQLGLELNSRIGEAYLVPYGTECGFIQGYKGKLKLAYNSDIVSSINANVVFEKDKKEPGKWVYEFGLNQKLEHKPNLDVKDRGKPIAVYAYAIMKDGSQHFVVLTMADIDKIKAKAQTDKIWKPWPYEMMKKSALHRLTKLLPLSTEDQRRIQTDHTVKNYIVGKKNIDMLIEPDQATSDEDEPNGKYDGEPPTANEQKPEKENDKPYPDSKLETGKKKDLFDG